MAIRPGRAGAVGEGGKAQCSRAEPGQIPGSTCTAPIRAQLSGRSIRFTGHGPANRHQGDASCDKTLKVRRTGRG